MNSIIVTAKEIKVNGFPVGVLPSLGFDYTALYYEPDIGNLFKFVPGGTGGELYNVPLLDSEIAQCAAFCAEFIAPVPEAPSEALDERAPCVQYTTYVDQYGFVRGVKPVHELGENEFAVSESALEATKYTSSDVPIFCYDFSSARFVGDTYTDKRLQMYYSSDISFGTQLGALWKCMEALQAAGAQLPDEALRILARISDIKNAVPKV